MANQPKGQINTSALFHSLLRNSKVAGIFVIDQEGTIVETNLGSYKSFGYSREDIVGQHFSILFIPEDREKLLPQRELKQVLETGSAMDNNYILHKSGDHIWVHGESILSKEGNNSFIIKIIYDINSQKDLEKRLLQKNAELNNFVYTASHDLKGPISNIEGLISLLPDIKNSDEGFTQIYELLEVSVKKFKNLLEDLSTIGKIQVGGEEDIAEVSFKVIYEEVKFDLSEQITLKNAQVLEDFSKAPMVKFSRKNLRSILYNLFSNSLKYSSSKRIPEISITSFDVDKYTVLKVSDNGLGIEKKDLKDVFSIYKRFHDHVEGTGVGMAIVKKIMDNNDGIVEIESEVDHGTSISVYFKKAILF